VRGLERQGRDVQTALSLPVTALPPFSMAFEWASRWLKRYEAYQLDAVDVVYNAYAGAGVYESRIMRLLPPELPALSSAAERVEDMIVETDPLRLYTRIVEQWSALSLYDILLEAAASEHSARYQLMESATQNTDRLIEELTMVIQSARRHAITREMQELAAGAGLLG
jgi:F-type H+-transporting ATPase subunit gamma